VWSKGVRCKRGGEGERVGAMRSEKLEMMIE